MKPGVRLYDPLNRRPASSGLPVPIVAFLAGFVVAGLLLAPDTSCRDTHVSMHVQEARR